MNHKTQDDLNYVQEESPAQRICIVAEAGSYTYGGEAVLPLLYFSRLRARNIEAWLIVHSRTQDEIERAFPNDLSRLHFIKDTWLHQLLYRIEKSMPRRIGHATFGLLSQIYTQYQAREIVQRLVAEESIDVIHQPIPVSPRAPSVMANLGVPVVIGPLNGGMEYPPAFRKIESAFTRFSIHAARSLTNLMNMLMPGKTQAEILLVANERTRRALPEGAQGTVIQLSENGVDLSTWSNNSTHIPMLVSTQRIYQSKRFIFIGRLVDWKGVDIIIEALRQVADAELEIIGDGAMRYQWESLVEKLGLGHRVTFIGWQSQKDCALHMESAVALLLPSVYECGGAVVLEAMAAGLPVIATKWGGPAEYLDESCGILIDPVSREALVRGFADAMRECLDTPEMCRRLGTAGKDRVQTLFDWDKKIDTILGIYKRATQK